MPTQVTIADLELGNLHSVVHAFKRVGCDAIVESDPERFAEADRLVVPGQGSFASCADAISGPTGEALLHYLRKGRPYLGICLGMQLLFESSEEAPGKAGLAYVQGKVRKFGGAAQKPEAAALKVPHMGWNQLDSHVTWLENQSWFYFVHSFYCAPQDTQIVAATADYGVPFCAALEHENVWACQFHPEKSATQGQSLLKAWLQR